MEWKFHQSNSSKPSSQEIETRRIHRKRSPIREQEFATTWLHRFPGSFDDRPFLGNRQRKTQHRLYHL